MIIDPGASCRVAGGHQTLTAVCTNGPTNYKSLRLLLPQQRPSGKVVRAPPPLLNSERRRLHLTGILTILTFALQKSPQA